MIKLTIDSSIKQRFVSIKTAAAATIIFTAAIFGMSLYKKAEPYSSLAFTIELLSETAAAMAFLVAWVSIKKNAHPVTKPLIFGFSAMVATSFLDTLIRRGEVLPLGDGMSESAFFFWLVARNLEILTFFLILSKLRLLTKRLIWVCWGVTVIGGGVIAYFHGSIIKPDPRTHSYILSYINAGYTLLAFSLAYWLFTQTARKIRSPLLWLALACLALSAGGFTYFFEPHSSGTMILVSKVAFYFFICVATFLTVANKKELNKKYFRYGKKASPEDHLVESLGIKTLEKENKQLKMAIDAHAIVAMTDSRGVITQVNDKFCEISKYSREELIGKTHRVINSGHHPREFFQGLWRTIARGKVWNGDVCNRAKDGSLYWVQSTIVPLIGKSGKPEQYIAIRADITSRKEAEAEMKRMALHDALTGLPNRRLMKVRLTKAISNKSEFPGYGAIVLMDLDHFKEINDTLGHDVGDSLLQHVTLRLSRSVREDDTVARFGGDEFVIIFDNLGDSLDAAKKNVEKMCEAIRLTLVQPYKCRGEQLEVTPSMGVVLFNSKNDNPEELIKQADIALYAAKEGGRNQLCFFSPLLQEETTERAFLLRDLRQAIEKDELALFYQPIVDDQAKIVGVEALLRWFHPKNGMIPPDKFIPIAEASGLILPIGDWVVKTACMQLSEWGDDPEREAWTMAINISARQLNQPCFVDSIKNALSQAGARSERLMLELTESVLQDNIHSTVTKMEALRHLGVRFSLDDFGTGYSSLSYLKRLPLDHLKIDKSFVDDIFDDPIDATIARTIIALGKNLEIGVIAEGVETYEQMKWLKANGCELFQGYLFSRPVSKDQVSAFPQCQSFL